MFQCEIAYIWSSIHNFRHQTELFLNLCLAWTQPQYAVHIFGVTFNDLMSVSICYCNSQDWRRRRFHKFMQMFHTISWLSTHSWNDVLHWLHYYSLCICLSFALPVHLNYAIVFCMRHIIRSLKFADDSVKMTITWKWADVIALHTFYLRSNHLEFYQLLSIQCHAVVARNEIETNNHFELNAK